GNAGTTLGAISINSSGNISTTGAEAIGINAATDFGPVDITSLGNIAVSGLNSIGINAQTDGDVRITSSGAISTGPNSSAAISALSQSNNVTIISTGAIATGGDVGSGIRVAAGAVAMVFSYGSIVTQGDGVTMGNYAAGIDVQADGGAAVLSASN